MSLISDSDARAKGAYFLADDGVLDWTLAMLASLRRYEPQLPVIWVPFGGRDEKLKSRLAHYQVAPWEDEELLGAWDAIGERFFPEASVGARLFRKMATLGGPLERFVFIDSDVILRRSLTWVFERFEASGAQLAFYDDGLADVYRDERLRQSMVEEHGSRGWNTGFWAGRIGALTPQIALSHIDAALAVHTGFAPTGEQPFFNFLLDHSAVRVASLREMSGTDPEPSLLVGRARVTDREPPALHWAGYGKPTLTMPHIGTWLGMRLQDRHVPYAGRLGAALVARLVKRRV
jgi:hypothetical protein